MDDRLSGTNSATGIRSAGPQLRVIEPYSEGVVSLSARYQAGEWAAVWRDIRTTPLSDLDETDVDDVASATTQRAKTQIHELVSRFMDMGLRSAGGLPVLTPPPPDVVAKLDVAERTTGRLPAALKALMTHVGGVSLMGDLPRLGLVYDANEGFRTMPPGPPFADPLVIPGIERLEYELAEYLDEDDPNEHGLLIPFAFAPDELHKANISGGEHTISLPSRAPDPVISGITGRPGITLVSYLRLSIAWGGLPGYAFAPHTAPELLSRLRTDPAF